MQDKERIEKLKDLFNTHNKKIFNLCLKMLGNQSEAEELTQDIFFKAYTSLNQFRSESNISTWLYRIAINLCLNYQRKKRYEQWLSLDFLSESLSGKKYNSDTPKNRPDIIAEKKELEHIVQKAINSLPSQQRIALILRIYDGLSYQEISEIMKCSISSVESRLHRAKENLAKKLIPLLKNY